MEAFKNALTVGLPAYLQSLPLPDTAEGFTKLNQEQWIAIAPVVLVILAHVFIVVSFFSGGSSVPSGRLNAKIDLDSPKVVTKEEFKGEKLVMCRCWKSKKFPYCDGSHTKHNEETGDNVGPLIILPSEK